MTVTGWVFAVALSAAAGRLILWTCLRRTSPYASTLEAVRDAHGAVEEYRVAPLGLACRGDVLVRHDRRDPVGKALLWRLRGLEPQEAAALLQAEGLLAELMPAMDGTVLAARGPSLDVSARARRRIAD